MSTTNYDRLIERVQKLLALAGNNPSEEEATAAALKAQELISQYNLELPEGEQKIEMVHYQFNTGKENTWKRKLGVVVGDNFRCKTYWNNKFTHVTFFGYKHDAETATTVFEYLFNYCRKRGDKLAVQQYKLTGTKAGFYSSYCEGFVRGVKASLDAQSVALMVVTPVEVEDDFNKYSESVGMRKSMSPSFQRWGYNAEALNTGIQDGKETMSRKQIANPA